MVLLVIALPPVNINFVFLVAIFQQKKLKKSCVWSAGRNNQAEVILVYPCMVYPYP